MKFWWIRQEYINILNAGLKEQYQISNIFRLLYFFLISFKLQKDVLGQRWRDSVLGKMIVTLLNSIKKDGNSSNYFSSDYFKNTPPIGMILITNESGFIGEFFLHSHQCNNKHKLFINRTIYFILIFWWRSRMKNQSLTHFVMIVYCYQKLKITNL